MKKLLSSTIAIGILAVASTAPAFANPAFTSGDSTFNANGVSHSANAVDNNYYSSFNVGKGESFNYEFTGYNQTFIEHVDQAGGISNIYGKITNSSSCPECNYAGTGKVFLLNPNGVIFGDGANVNVNSFTAAASTGKWDSAKNELALTNPTGDIKVLGGAEVYGDKAVNFFAKNVDLYKGSKLSTNVGKNFN